ncbi:hypothetical protein [Aeromicrobium sp.]|uniref:hypothetical protein n=1 Tax=Aeromicrobium sp. TaxID=1871063 RepID=UPI0019872021|nr:hypothetical protein [Aeromicrobium sp.]MBC7631641.1 hypothetical protein [Aeromicrobium sp.]
MKTPARAFVLLLATAAVLVASTGAASADEPVGPAWPGGEGRSALDILILFGGGTIALFVLIALFGLMTARTNYVPPAPSTEIERVGDGDNTPAARH